MKKTIAILTLILILVSSCSRETVELPQKPPVKVDSSAQQTVSVSKQTQNKQAAVKPKTPEEKKPIETSKTETAASVNRAETKTQPVKKAEPALKTEPKKNQVTLSIINTYDSSVILQETTVSLQDGDTVFKVLKRLTRDKKIQMEFSGKGNNVYVEGINNLYEFDRGPESGWIYTVNGKTASQSAGATKLNSGDCVIWKYITSVSKLG